MPAAAAVAAITSPPELSLPEGRLWCELIERRCGVFFPESQWRRLRRGLWDRMQAASIPSYSHYYCLLTEDRWQPEWARLLEGLLNPETSFFRHQPSFKALRAILGERGGSLSEPCSLWSAGCSTGEEAYSLAMTALTATGAAGVVGSDLSPGALARARSGIFSGRQITGVPVAWRPRFLSEARAGQFEVSSGLRQCVRFEPFHLLDPGTYPRREFDVIFCFNVLIYFRRPARQEALTGLLGRLKPGGHLFLAPGESAGLALAGAGPMCVEGTQVWRRAS